MPLEVYAAPLCRRHVAPTCSLAAAVSVCLLAATAFLPLAAVRFARVGSDALLAATPRVLYAGQLTLVLWGMRNGSAPMRLGWTTSAAANALLAGDLRESALLTAASASDGGGALRLTVSTPLAEGETVTGVQMAAYLDVRLEAPPRLRMDALAAAGLLAGVPGAACLLDGDATLLQRGAALPRTAGGGAAVYRPYRDSALPALDNASSLEGVLPGSIVALYRERSITLVFAASFPQWLPAAAPDGSGSGNSGARSFNTTIIIRAASSIVRAQAGAGETVLAGLEQYLAALVPIALLAWVARAVLFGGHVLESSVYADAPHGRIHLE